MMHVGRPAKCYTMAETPIHSVHNFITLKTMARRRTGTDHVCVKASKVDRSYSSLMLAHMKLASAFTINDAHRYGLPTLGTLRLWCSLQHAARTAAVTALVFWEHF
jgi:hypothetical protein